MDNEEKALHEQSILNVGNDSHIENILIGGKSARALGVIIIVLFVGILLSFLVNFGVSAYLGTGERADSYFDGAEHPGIILPEFADAFYLSESLRQNIIRVDYYLFGRIHTDDVLLGRNNFLFPAYDKENNYNYIADYLGEIDLKGEELNRYYFCLSRITDAYAEYGAECYFVIIPNSQTVYSENMPEFMGDISQNTRLSSVSNYFARRGVKNYLDLTDTLKNAKQYGELYNNTEDSLNSRGAYYAYLAALSLLPSEAQSEIIPVELSEDDLVRHTTAGRELARKAMLEDVIKNRSVSLSTDFEQKYQVLLRYEDYDMAFSKLGYINSLPSHPKIQFAFSSDWDRIIMIDYFSNTFGTTIYRNSLSFNEDVLKKNGPRYVIIFLHEKDLGKLIDGSLLPN